MGVARLRKNGAPRADFVHLHVHSEYSLLDGAAHLEKLGWRAGEEGKGRGLIARAAELRLSRARPHRPRQPLRRRRLLHGLQEGRREAHPRLASSTSRRAAASSARGRTAATRARATARSSSATETGYANLIKLVSKAYLEGYYYKPRVDRELLAQHADGLLVLSGCLNSEVSRQLSAGDEAKALETAGWYQEVFGKDYYFMEVQSHGLEEQRGSPRARSGSPARSARRSCGTNDSHYLEAEHARGPRGAPVHPDRHDHERPEPLALLDAKSST